MNEIYYNSLKHNYFLQTNFLQPDLLQLHLLQPELLKQMNKILFINIINIVEKINMKKGEININVPKSNTLRSSNKPVTTLTQN